MDKIDNRTPVIILGGDTNTLSLTRSFGRQNIPVTILAKAQCPAASSRYCREFMTPVETSFQPSIKAFWYENLLQRPLATLQGAVIFACDDEAVEFLAEYKDQLSKNYRLDDFIPPLHLDMLDKQKTLELAAQAGCQIPQFWNIQTREDLDDIAADIPYPVMLKPIHSHQFQKHFYKKKYLLAENRVELFEQSQQMFKHQLEFMLCEVIPGPDSNLCSYYTYLDGESEALFHFTKRIIRRYPVNSGIGTAQITQWIPETAELGQRFFHGIGFKGMGHVEFKRDPRDGQLKVIECNPRYSAAQEVITQSGMDMALLVYLYMTGQRQPVQSRYRDHVRLLFPIQDFMAFCQLQLKDQLSFLNWLKSILHRQVFPVFSWSDPLPSVMRFKHQIFNKLKRNKP